MKFHRMAGLGVLLAMTLSGCQHTHYPFLYRPPLSQGNVMESGNFALLRVGMNSAEVVNLVGEPVLQTPLTPNRWTYVYLLQEKGKVVQHQQIILTFAGDRLVAISR